MEFSEFKNQLLTGISKNDKSCLSLINKNEKLVKEYLNANNLNIVIEFIEDLYLPIINEKKFKLIEKVLKHSLMTIVLNEFKKSDFLIRACKEGKNKKAIEWLISMDVDLDIQDEYGKTALMYAVEHWDLESVIDTFLKIRGDYICAADNEGNSALFYACINTPIFKKLLKSNLFDYNHINKNGDNVLLYCIKRDKLRSMSLLMEKSDLDYNCINNVGKTAAMLLVENARFNELKIFVEKYKIDVNYKNKNDETLVTVFIKKYYDQFVGNIEEYFLSEYNYMRIKNFGQTLVTLIDIGCDFNCPIDGDGNTPVMFYLVIKDYVSLYYLLKNCGNLDLSIKNKYGINASYLSLFMKEEDFEELSKNKKGLNHINYNSMKSQFMFYKTFDFDYIDYSHNNLLIHSLVRNDGSNDKYISLILEKISPKVLFAKNNKNENAIIIATKLGNYSYLEKILQNKECTIVEVNSQDYLGNTALHYATQLKDNSIIGLLKKYHADPSIKNDEKEPAMESSENISDDESNIMVLHTNAIPSSVMENQSEKQKLISVLTQRTDNKVNNDIKSYRIEVYQKEYSYLLKNDTIFYYKPSKYGIMAQHFIGDVLFPNHQDEINLINRMIYF